MLPPPPASLKLSPFYKQWLDAGGIPIVASEKVSPYALQEARFLMDRLLEKRSDVRKAIARAGVRVAIMATSERTTDIPEHSDLTPKDYWDRRARGLGATRWRPAISGAEESILNAPGDPYLGESIFLHEFSHTVDEMGLRKVESDFESHLRACYDAALKAGLWKDTYAATNISEYWAEGVQSFLDANQARLNPSHNGIWNREKLRTYDPAFYALIEKSLRISWRYKPWQSRPEAERKHLKGLDITTLPTFSWEKR
ncbi:MAG: hypothetical protein QM758_21210 [Armatimonas sp.]